MFVCAAAENTGVAEYATIFSPLFTFVAVTVPFCVVLPPASTHHAALNVPIPSYNCLDPIAKCDPFENTMAGPPNRFSLSVKNSPAFTSPVDE
jgi:hypothetical protein